MREKESDRAGNASHRIKSFRGHFVKTLARLAPKFHRVICKRIIANNVFVSVIGNNSPDNLTNQVVVNFVVAANSHAHESVE